MVDPEIGHGFVYNSQGQVDILRSPFFDLNLEVDDTVNNYVDCIIFTLVPSIEEHLPSGQWRISGHPPTSSSPATFPLGKAVGVLLLSMASFSLLKFFSR
ncbi:hypothetical protein M5K25_015859 [Dendrobium thyrsiflorum]|uniref:Uncharacterized protein n=1 Tax=Dendrobium thyrsiflorum TaxID=117978 RepID=A0ABD0UY99_DENTH